MKKRILIFLLVFLLLPFVSAIPPAPYSVLSADGNWVPVRVDKDGNPVAPLFTHDKERFKNLDVSYGKRVFEQKGDDNYAETYDTQTQCPIVFQKDVTTGKPHPYIGRLQTDGYFQADTNLPFTPDIRVQDVESQGLVCGFENVQQVRPLRPASPVYHDSRPPVQREFSNAQSGVGVMPQPNGAYTYYNPQLQQQQQDGEIAPPPRNEPKPIIIFTGQAIYDDSQYHQQNTLGTIVIPVQFSGTLARASLDDVQQQIFGESDSLASYYSEQSGLGLDLVGTVAPSWYTMSEDMAYYGDNYEENIEQMVVEAVQAADADVDFSQYDLDGDGVVDELLVVHAGEPDENGGGNGADIWSHYYSIDPISVDGVEVIDYETVSESSPTGIIVHEFGHSLGLPDLYDTVTDDGSSKGTAEWSIMGYGGYTSPPSSFDPWSKKYLGWATNTVYQEITSNGYYTILQDSSSENGIKYFAVPISSTEEFLIENRHKENLLSGDSSGGVLIWHIDELVINESGTWNGCSGTRWDCNTVNGNAKHKLVDVEEAGMQVIDQDKLAAPEDPWYSSCGTFGGCHSSEFSSRSDPAAVSYDGNTTIYIGVYSDIGTTMKLGVTLDGSSLPAPAGTSVSSSSSSAHSEAVVNSSPIVLYVVIGISLLLVLGGAFLAWRLLRKKNVVVVS